MLISKIQMIQKYTFAVFTLFLLALPCVAQKKSWPVRLLNKMFNDTIVDGKPKWIAYPTLAYSPETSWEIGLSSVVVYNAKEDTNNRLSEISGFTFFTLAGQYGVNFEHAIYTDQDKWFFLGKLKSQSYPLLYYGIGNNIVGEELAIAHANVNAIRERILRKIKGHWYLGAELDFQRLTKVDFEWMDGYENTPVPNGGNGYSNLGLGIGLVYDTRHNVLNVREGALMEIGYLVYSSAWGSTNNLGTLFIDSRLFKEVNEHRVWAGQIIGQFSQGDVPFNQLSMIGGEMMMRGFYLGKFRDKNMLGAQLEHRWLPFKFSKRIGASVFGSIGYVSPNLKIDKMLWSVGGGVRVLLFPNRDIFSRLDVGVNPYGYGFYIFVGQAF